MSRRASKRKANILARASATPKTVKAVDGMLYGKSEESLQEFLDVADQDAVKRLERISKQDEEDKAKWLRKQTTRADVFNAMSIWQTRYLMPMAARLDAVERYLDYLEKPFYERWALRSKAWIIWLGAKLPFKFRRLHDDGEVDRQDGHDGADPAQSTEGEGKAP